MSNPKKGEKVSEFKIVTAKREGLLPLIGLYGKTGGGKTHSALLLARGIVGNSGSICLIDTENKRGHILSDVIPGGYNVLDFSPPFTPARYIDALKVAEKSDIIVIDSMTHEWAGEGGVLDMQEEELERMAKGDFKRRETCKMASWIKPKMAHKKMIGQILRIEKPVICCFRGEQKTHSAKDAKGKNTVVTDDFSTPIFDSRFIFEMLINGEVFSNEKGDGGFVRITKISHKGLRPCLPEKGEQAKICHGEKIAEWCSPTKESPLASIGLQKSDFEIFKEKLIECQKVFELSVLWDDLNANKESFTQAEYAELVKIKDNVKGSMTTNTY